MPDLAVDEFEFVRTGKIGRHASARTAVCPLSARHMSVRTARDFAEQTLRDWGAEQLLDDLGLVVSELVANALRHGLRLAATDAMARPLIWYSTWPLQLSLLQDGPRLLCAVNDPSNEEPVRARLAAQSGRGLRLVEALSLAWGSVALVRNGKAAGKAVWALFSLSDDAVVSRPHVAVFSHRS